jgi:AIPR protein
MTISIEEFHQDFFQEVMASADVDGLYAEDAFFDLFCEYLSDSGEFDGADRASYCPSVGGVRVDGYAGDPAQSGGVLSLVILDFSQSPELVRLIQTDMNAIFKRLENFLNKSLDAKFRNSLEETSAAFGLADLIAARWPLISKIRLFLVSNRQLSSKVDGREAGEVDGRHLSYSVWDIERLHRFAAAGFAREEIAIDLEAEFGGGIPLLPAHMGEADYKAYLAVVPGAQLASIYDRWGSRLLEQNVRVFLQARGGVNKGIRNTIDNDPDMFFAYNNGITATAEGITTRESGDGLLLTGLRNLQIVNGGQTTASIHAAKRRNADLSKVFVQMKLSIVPAEKAIDIVPKISEFANSQNRVNAADFFANHPFHVRLEEFSRRIFAPSPDGTFRESKWFYERARGQYQDARGLLTVAQRKKFDLEYPKSQLISKTDLGKYLNVWRGYPDIVSKGAQKNFVHFADWNRREWAAQPDSYNEAFFRYAVAKALVFRATEEIVTEQSWYQGGYRANVVAYAIAKMGSDCEKREEFVNFEAVWRAQGISENMGEAIARVAEAVHDVLVSPPAGVSNVTEWAKQQACWARVKAIEVDWPEEWLTELVGTDHVKEDKRAGIKDQRLLNGIEAQSMVVSAGCQLWQQLSEWGQTRKLLSPTEISILRLAASVPIKIPTEKQALKLIESIRKLRVEGCQIGMEVLP